MLWGERMKIVFKSMALFVMFPLLLAIWLPHYMIGTTASTENDSKGLTIGGVEVGDLKGEELKIAITNVVNEWYTQPIIVTDGRKSIQISSKTFQFDIDGTLKYYEEHYKKPWYAFWTNESTAHLPLNLESSEIVKNEISNIKSWETDATYERVAMNASYLKTSEIEAVVGDLSLVDADRISLSIEAIPKEAQGLDELVKVLNEMITEPQAVFSLLENLGEAIPLANSEAVNFLASNVYNAALYINGEIIERHSQNRIPSYLKPGIEAKVDVSSNEDLQFINTLSNPIQLKLTIEDQKLMTEVYTSNKDTAVSVSVNRDGVIQPRTITRYSEELAIGTTKQLQEGIEGLRVSVYRTVYGVEQLVSRDYYSPVNRILLKSSRQPETENSPASSNESSNGSNNDPAYVVDLDGDGFPDSDLSENQQSEEDSLPAGSYYDKGGNIITPKKGGK